MLDNPSASYCIEAADIKKNPHPIIITPIAILNNEEDSRFLFFHHTQKLPTRVAKIKIKIALTDWNQLAGTVKFSVKTKSVFCAAYTFNRPPACSNDPQKTIIIKKDK